MSAPTRVPYRAVEAAWAEATKVGPDRSTDGAFNPWHTLLGSGYLQAGDRGATTVSIAEGVEAAIDDRIARVNAARARRRGGAALLWDLASLLALALVACAEDDAAGRGTESDGHAGTDRPKGAV